MYSFALLTYLQWRTAAMGLHHCIPLALVVHSQRLLFVHCQMLPSHLYCCLPIPRLPSILFPAGMVSFNKISFFHCVNIFPVSIFLKYCFNFFQGKKVGGGGDSFPQNITEHAVADDTSPVLVYQCPLVPYKVLLSVHTTLSRSPWSLVESPLLYNNST